MKTQMSEMEKNSYETYEFLASTNTDSDSNQFYVLQEDGAILTVNKEIQYMTKVENDNNVPGSLNTAEGCTPVFNVPSQQYYVEFEGNASEMICLNDQFAITDGENNVYANSYLIQPENTSGIQQMETETFIDPQTLDAHQIQQLNVEAFNGTKQTTDLTEITLTDEQYKILEQKGWLLLESNDKVFVLNTLGLHDITANDKLVCRLKNELEKSPNTDPNVGQLKIESVSSFLPNENTDTTTEEQCSVVEYFIANNVPVRHVEPVESIRFIIGDNAEEMHAAKSMPNPSETNIVTEVPVSYKFWNNADANSKVQEKYDSIKIKTKYIFKDVPEKIFLGKTVTGKKIFAKVKKKSNEINDKDKKIEKQSRYISLLDGASFTNLIQESFRHVSKASPKHVAYAQAVVSQLLRLPNLKHSVLGNKLVVTKVITCYSENGKNIGQPTMVTGTVQVLNGEDTFIHSPLMLQELLYQAEEKSKTPTDQFSNCPEEKTARGLVELLHIHISETRYTDRVAETSINLSERKLPLDVLNDAKKRHPNPAYACGTCGAVFISETQLKEHQDDECIEVEDELTIDTDDFSGNIATLYSVKENGKEKVYSCTICETKFTRLFNCKKHIKAHKAGIENKLKAYKCKMCPNTYFHSSSLSKHIVKTHIQMKLN